MKTKRLILAVIPVLLFALLQCSNEYDPYNNYSNAQVHLLTTAGMLKNGDTVNIFTTDTLGFFATVEEKIAGISLHADSNMLWTDTSVASPVSSGDYRFLLSFADTGKQQVTISTKRTNGDVSTLTLSLFARSPLRQDSVVCALGSPLTLSTKPVGDRVYYSWSFGTYRGYTETVTSPFATCPVHQVLRVEAGKTLTGFLWVTDTLNKYKSPAFPFSYLFTDSTGPQIVYTGKGLHGDTIVTGENTFTLTISAVDISGNPADSVELVGGRIVSSNRVDYAAVFTGMSGHPAGSPIVAIVNAWDLQGNVTRDTFYIVYDAAGPKADLVKLSLDVPTSTSFSTRLSNVVIVLGVANKSGDTVVMRSTVNGQPFPPEKAVTDTTATVGWNMPLAAGSNTILVTASVGQKQYAETTYTIVQNVSAQDTDKPYIAAVAVDSTTLTPQQPPYFYTTKRSVNLGAVAFDAGSGVASVTANGLPMYLDTAKYIWVLPGLQLLHPYTSVVIKATDVAGNFSSWTVVVVSNSLPVIVSPKSLPQLLFAGIPLNDTIVARDDDNDTVFLTMNNEPAGMKLTQVEFYKWVLSYLPTPSDTGLKNVVFTMRDPYSKAITMPWLFYVARDTSLLVRFITPSDSFPTVLQAGRDTLKVRLAVKSGFPQFHFAAYHDGNIKIYSSDTASRTVQLSWAPQPSDTGFRQLLVTVRDSAGQCDTIRPLPIVTVVPKNQYPCSLSVVPNMFYKSGMLDMTLATHPDTLLFAISDLDNPLTEYYTVNVTLGNITAMPTLLFVKLFQVIVTPTSSKHLDTLRVSVTDRTGTHSTIILPIVYTAYMPSNLSGQFMWNTDERGTITLGTGAKAASVTKWSPYGYALDTLVQNMYLDSMPTYVTPTSSGSVPLLPYLHFSRAQRNNLLTYSLGTWPLKPFTAFFVARLDTVQQDSSYAIIASCESYGANAAIGVTKNGTFGMFDGTDNIRYAGSRLTVDPHRWYLFAVASPGAQPDSSLTFRVWANSAADSNLVLAGAGSGPYLMAGASGKLQAADAWNGDIAEMMGFSRVLTNDEFLAVYQYLASKYKYMLQQ
jgi:hypothetical protein